MALITLCCFIFVKPEPLELEEDGYKTPIPRLIVYLALFALSILIVFRGVPYIVGLIVIPLVLLFLDRRALLNVDYGLLLTFCFFFVFSGNMGRIEAVREFFSMLLEKSTLIVSALSCQVISNVPAAVVLSGFTDQWQQMLSGVNIGGLGTPIASLASLITFSEFRVLYPGHGKSYFWKFTYINAIFLGVLLIAARLFFI